jgi:alpha-tubulin suppressor-like RCC1 family protein/streptogramin lyase
VNENSWLKPLRRLCAKAASGALLLLAACSGGSMNPSATTPNAAPPPTSSAARSLPGVLHGGQQPITGSTLTLYAAGVPANVAPTTLSTATTDGNGNFNFQYTCPSANALMYVVAGGGNAGGGSNAAIKLMAALGPCGSLPSFIVVNELTTVAAVYALNAFSDITSTSGGLSGCADCVAGSAGDMTQLHGKTPAIANAFSTAGLLATPANGEPATFLPPAASCAAASPPVNCSGLGRLTALANSLAACVNSAAGSAQCTNLLKNYSSGNDTLQATLNIARNPGLIDITGIYNLSTRNAVFAPGLSAAPTDWTISLSFSGGGLADPRDIAIDANGNVWVTNEGGYSVTELSGGSGSALSPANGFTGGGLAIPQGVAIDGNGNVWVSSYQLGLGGTDRVSEFSGSTGSALSPDTGFTGGGLDYQQEVTNDFFIAIDGNGNVWVTLHYWSIVAELSGSTGSALSPASGFTGGLPGASGIAIDANGNVWVANNGDSSSVTELSGSTGSALSPTGGFTGGGLNVPFGIAIDANGNVWVANEAGHSVTELSGSTGSALSPDTGFTGGGLANPNVIAIDGNGNVWVGNAGAGAVAELSGSTGSALSPATGFTGGGLSSTFGIAIDGGGDVWVTDRPSDSVTEIIGAAAPVITPLVAQIAQGAKLSSITVTPAGLSIGKGSTQQFTATGTYSDGQTGNVTSQVTWSSANPAIASITASGLATCVSATTQNVTITASRTLANTTIISGATTLTCTPASLVSITVNPAAPSIAANATQQFTVSGLNADGSTSTPTVTWSVQGGSANGTITSSGLYTGPNAAVEATVVATSTVNGAITGTATVSVAAPPPVSVEVAPSTASLAAGAQQQFSASVLNDPTTTVNWSVDESGGGSVTTSGLYTAPNAGGTFHVRATSTSNSSAYGEATVTVVAPATTASSVQTGNFSTCALVLTGTVECWGFNSFGQLGNGTTTTSLIPVAVSGMTTAKAVSLGPQGLNACAVLANGTVQCWGDDEGAQLGSILAAGYSSTPISVPGITTATSVSNSGSEACAVLAGGTVECWGYDGSGGLGDGSGSTLVTGPVAVSGITTATAVAVAENDACALLANGTVQCWGQGQNGQLGNGTTAAVALTPVTVSGITTATAITVGGVSACALLANGTIQCWGGNTFGELGNNSTANSPIPVTVNGITSAVAVSANNFNACAVLANGSADCWGPNTNGQLGNGTTTSSLVPVPVTGITTATQISTGFGFACATLAGGSVQCWGINTDGQLGNNSTTESLVPVVVGGL